MLGLVRHLCLQDSLAHRLEIRIQLGTEYKAPAMDRRKEPAGRCYVVPFLYHIWAEISCSKNAHD